MEKTTCILYNEFDADRQNLAALLREFDFIEIVSQSNNLKKSLALVNELEPNLFFLAIKANESNAFQVLEKIKKQPTIVFISNDKAHIEMFEQNQFHYLTTPFKLTDIQKLLRNFQKTHQQLAVKMQGLLGKLKLED